jgi:hypothetical protein
MYAAASALVAVCLLTPAATFGQAAPTAQDPRIGQMKGAIERTGVRVLDAGVSADTGFGGERVPGWWVNTAATYARPSYRDVFGQLTTVASAMHDVLANQPPAEIFSVGQIWTKYNIIGRVRRADVTTLLSTLRSASSQQARDAALRRFFDGARWRVLDIERQQWVDVPDFVNKNFGTTAVAVQSQPNPPAPAPGAPTVRALMLVADSATSVGPGERVLFRIGIGLSAPSSSPLEVTLGWRAQDGQFTYGQFMPITTAAGDFTVSGICLRVMAKRDSPPPPPGSGGYVRLEVYGVIRVGSQPLFTQTPIVVEARGQAPIPNPPAPTPARTPAESSCRVVMSTE